MKFIEESIEVNSLALVGDSICMSNVCIKFICGTKISFEVV
jgi:hypothetical protein